MIPKLDEFTAEQLQLLLNGLERYRYDISKGDFMFKSLEDKRLVDDLNLLRTQLLNAISTVQLREREISN